MSGCANASHGVNAYRYNGKPSGEQKGQRTHHSCHVDAVMILQRAGTRLLKYSESGVIETP